MDKETTGYDQPPAYPGGRVEPQQPGQAYPQYQGYPPNQQYGHQGFMQNNTTVVMTQPTTTNTVIVQARPPDYMMSSILACLFCFWPTGLVAIYFAFESRRYADMGDVANAGVMSARARNMMISSVVIGLAWIILVIVLAIAGVFQTRQTYYYNY